jgi:hypothetical protein
VKTEKKGQAQKTPPYAEPAAEQVANYDRLDTSICTEGASQLAEGDHIITFAKQTHNIWRSQIHNPKLIRS